MASQQGAQERHKLSLGHFYSSESQLYEICVISYSILINLRISGSGDPKVISKQFSNKNFHFSFFHFQTHCAIQTMVPEILGFEILRMKRILSDILPGHQHQMYDKSMLSASASTVKTATNKVGHYGNESHIAV